MLNTSTDASVMSPAEDADRAGGGETPILWSPDQETIAGANLTRFRRVLGLEHLSYEALHRWSVSRPDAFWGKLWDFCGVVGTKGDVVIERSSDTEMLGTRWFPEATLNFAENLLDGEDELPAVITAGEEGVGRRVTRGELRELTARAAEGLLRRGVREGHCVAGVLPNNLEALVALLATAAIGATWSSCSPDFGVVAILDRLGQIKPRVLFAARTYRHGAKDHDIGARLVEIAAGLEGLGAIVLTDGGDALPGDVGVPTLSWAMLTDNDARRPAYVRTPFSQPLYVLYTSGTTGQPKGIVHSVGGVLLQHLKEHALHSDVKPGDTVCWYTNTAWMMYHWLVSTLACKAAVVLCDGAAMPKGGGGSLDLGLLWRVAEAAGVTHFGTSPKYLSTLQAGDYAPGSRHDLARLRWLLSAGAPVAPEQFDWIYAAIKRDMVFASISGGTEIIGCFFIGNPMLPVRRGELTCKALGLAVDVMDERNASVVGRRGDLVCTEPFPAMPLTFWGPGGDERYRATYFAVRPGIWTHGDLAEQTIHGSGIIYGRTDTTLKPGGVRIGTAEIYAIVEAMPEVADLLVFGATFEGDEEVVLCIVPADGFALDTLLAARIRKEVRERASPRHVPHRIHEVRDIPYTLNGKRVETAARTMVAGGVVKNVGSLANPGCLADFADLKRGEAL